MIVNGVGRAHVPGKIESFADDIYGDDGVSADDAGRHDRCQTNCSRAENGDARSRRNSQGIHHRTPPGLLTAAQGGKEFQGNVIGDDDEVALRHQGVSGKG